MPLRNLSIQRFGSIEKIATCLVIPAQAGIQESLIVVGFLRIMLYRFAKKYVLTKVSPTASAIVIPIQKY